MRETGASTTRRGPLSFVQSRAAFASCEVRISHPISTRPVTAFKSNLPPEVKSNAPM